MKLQKSWDEFARRNTVAIAIAQEDTDYEAHAKFLAKGFAPDIPFPIVADIGHEQTAAYDRTTTYLIDPAGTVREIFPALIHMRPDWRAVLHRLDEIRAEDDA